MLVKNWMNRSVITVDASDPIEKAIKLIEIYRHRMLPVIDKDKLVGIITDRDIKAATGLNCSEAGHLDSNFVRQKVRNIMITNPYHALPELTVEEAAELLLLHQISGLPVINNENTVVGVITKSDLFKLWITLTGERQDSFQIGINTIDKPGCILEIADIIRDYGGIIETILSTIARVRKGSRRIYIRFYNIDNVFLENLLKELNEKYEVLYIVDYATKRREIFESDKVV